MVALPSTANAACVVYHFLCKGCDGPYPAEPDWYRVKVRGVSS